MNHDITIPPAAPPPWPDGFYRIERPIMDCCATEGCGQVPSMRLEIEGTGSVYCEPCARKIAAIQARPVDAALTIPPEALEAAAIDLHRSEWGADAYSWADLESDTRDLFRNHARAACLAMLKAWPGMKLNPSWELRTHKRSVEMILPLPQQNTND